MTDNLEIELSMDEPVDWSWLENDGFAEKAEIYILSDFLYNRQIVVEAGGIDFSDGHPLYECDGATLVLQQSDEQNNYAQFQVIGKAPAGYATLTFPFNCSFWFGIGIIGADDEYKEIFSDSFEDK